MDQNIGTTCMNTHTIGGPFNTNLFLISKEFLFHASCSRLSCDRYILLYFPYALIRVTRGPFFTLINQE